MFLSFRHSRLVVPVPTLGSRLLVESVMNFLCFIQHRFPPPLPPASSVTLLRSRGLDQRCGHGTLLHHRFHRFNLLSETTGQG